MTKTPETPSTDGVEITEQPALPTLELPDYHGRKPVGMKSTVNGASNRLSRPHGIGDRIVVVVEAVVRTAGHSQTDDGLLYTETLKVDDMFEIQGDNGSRLLSTVRSLHRTASDAHDGKSAIPSLGEVGYTDASGVVMTAKEVAALRGDPLRAMISDELTPVVVKYESGARLVWPDEYGTDEPRPLMGQAHPDDHEEGVDADRVVELLHHATGEPITDERRFTPEPEAVKVDDEDDDADFMGDPEDHRTTLKAVPDYGDVDDLGAGVEPYDEPGDDEPDPDPTLPTPSDFSTVDTTVPKLRERIAGIGDRVMLERLLNAEKQGRGRGLIPRKGALDVLEAAVAAATS